jgi:hypothetical protein
MIRLFSRRQRQKNFPLDILRCFVGQLSIQRRYTPHAPKWILAEFPIGSMMHRNDLIADCIVICTRFEKDLNLESAPDKSSEKRLQWSVCVW